MINKLRRIFCFVLFCTGSHVYAQSPVKDFSKVDDYVKKLGAFDSLNMGTISGIVTKPFTDKTEKARAIYDWITEHITYDCKTARTGNTQKNTPTEVLLYRKAVGLGFAALFQDMCSSANIRCLIPDGYIKFNTDQIEESKTDVNHCWAVVQLGISPDEWYYVDPAMGSGTTDAEMKTFTKNFSSAYFFADKQIFNWQHYPDNEAWKLGATPKNKKDFYELPLIKGAAYEFGLKKFSPGKGKIKVKTGNPQEFSFTLDSNTVITKVSLRIGEPKKQKVKEVAFSLKNNVLSFSNKFPDGDYPVTIEVNGRELAVYLVESSD